MKRITTKFNNIPHLWSVTDVAGHLKVSRSWVYHRVEAREIPHIRIGGILRFDPETIRTWAGSHVHSFTATADETQQRRRNQ